MFLRGLWPGSNGNRTVSDGSQQATGIRATIVVKGTRISTTADPPALFKMRHPRPGDIVISSIASLQGNLRPGGQARTRTLSPTTGRW